MPPELQPYFDAAEAAKAAVTESQNFLTAAQAAVATAEAAVVDRRQEADAAAKTLQAAIGQYYGVA